MARAGTANGTRAGRSLDWRSAVHFAQGALAATLLVAVGVVAVRWGNEAGNLPIRAVKVEGSLRHLDPAELKRAVAAHVGGGFFAVDINAIRGAVLQRPWVDQVWVRRVWPDTLRIRVHEHVALARWGEHGLLSERGIWFAAPQEGAARELPRLSGPEGLQAALAKRYRSLRERIEPLGMRLAGIQVSDRRAWRITLDNGIEVRLGRGDVDELMTRFLDLYPRVLADAAGRVQTVDLRYTNGFAVRWKPQERQPGEAEPAVNAS